MGQTGQASAKEETAKVEAQTENGTGHSHKAEGLGKLYMPSLQDLKKKKSCGRSCLRVLHVLLSFIVIAVSIAVIAVTVTTAIATKIYSSDLSGRLVAMIILAVTAAVTLSIAIYALVAVCRSDKKPLHAATAALMILAIIQSVIAGVAVRVTTDDEVKLGRSLSESFRLATEDNPRHIKLWSTTQHDLDCCGVYSAEDYRTPKLPVFFPPNVPISCCPTFDPDRSELVQERERESCKARKEYHDVGCKNLVVEVFRETASMVLTVTIMLIVLEVVLAILSSTLSREKKKTSAEEVDGKPTA